MPAARIKDFGPWHNAEKAVHAVRAAFVVARPAHHGKTFAMWLAFQKHFRRANACRKIIRRHRVNQTRPQSRRGPVIEQQSIAPGSRVIQHPWHLPNHGKIIREQA